MALGIGNNLGIFKLKPNSCEKGDKPIWALESRATHHATWNVKSHHRHETGCTHLEYDRCKQPTILKQSPCDIIVENNVTPSTN